MLPALDLPLLVRIGVGCVQVNEVVHSQDRAEFARLLADLKFGKLCKTAQPYKTVGVAGQLFYASRMSGTLAIVWTIEIQAGSQVICLLRHVTSNAIGSAWTAFEASVQVSNSKFAEISVRSTRKVHFLIIFLIKK